MHDIEQIITSTILPYAHQVAEIMAAGGIALLHAGEHQAHVMADHDRERLAYVAERSGGLVRAWFWVLGGS